MRRLIKNLTVMHSDMYYKTDLNNLEGIKNE